MLFYTRSTFCGGRCFSLLTRKHFFEFINKISQCLQYRNNIIDAQEKSKFNFMKKLIEALNEHNFMAFPRKDGKGISLTVAGEDGKRYFLTRVPLGIQDDGSQGWGWARGQAMRDKK